jgi:spore coat protein A
VNGVATPFTRVPAARHRLRFLNTSSFRSYNLKLEGLAMVQIATESGLMPRAVRRRKILLGPGERAEVVVDFAKARGDRVVLRSVRRRDEAGRKLGSKPFVGDVMKFRVGKDVLPDSTATLGKLQALNPLRPLPAWVADIDPNPSHTWRIEIGTGLRPSWLINGRTFDPGFVEETAKPEIGEVVTWRLRNATGVAHLLHLHHTDWYMLKRNGKTPPAHERCLKETFFLDPGDEVVVAGKMSDFTGKYVVHCHMLDHEDHGLMSQFEIQPAAAD